MSFSLFFKNNDPSDLNLFFRAWLRSAGSTNYGVQASINECRRFVSTYRPSTFFTFMPSRSTGNHADKKMLRENDRWMEVGDCELCVRNSGRHHSAKISSGSMASIKSNSIRFLMAFWKSLMVIPEANAILAILFRPSKTLKIFTISSSRRWSFLGASPEHRKTRILKLALGFDIGISGQVFLSGICSQQSVGGLHAHLTGCEHKQPHCLVKWQPGCLP